MSTRRFSLAFGAVYVLVGVLGFIPGLQSSAAHDAPHVDVTTAYGLLLGLFPVNILHNLFHIVVGVIAIICYTSVTAARYFCQVLFFLFGILTIMGFMPGLNTTFGLLPLYGADTWLHAATAIVAGYFGFVALEPTSLPDVAPAH